MREPYQPTLIRATSVRVAGSLASRRERPRTSFAPVSGGTTKNEKVGGDGAKIFTDCDGAEKGRLTWERGQITDEGEETIEVGGCDDGSS